MRNLVADLNLLSVVLDGKWISKGEVKNDNEGRGANKERPDNYSKRKRQGALNCIYSEMMLV
jgi:hypothetical protein